MAKILIADDSDAIRLVLKDILSIGEHEVLAEAVDFYKKYDPEVLLLDLAMPKKDGFTVVQEVMKHDPKAKIILITANDDQKIIQQCLDHGASSYISKPFDFNGVLESIKTLI